MVPDSFRKHESVYVKAFSVPAADKLVSMFAPIVPRPGFLAESERRPLYLVLLLEGFNNHIQSEYRGNTSLVCSIQDYKNTFPSSTRSGSKGFLVTRA